MKYLMLAMTLSSLFFMSRSSAQLPLDMFWGVDQFHHPTSINQLSKQQNHLQYQIQHDQIWQKNKPHSNDKIKHQQQKLSLVVSPYISNDAEIKLQLSQNREVFIARQTNTDWRANIRQYNNSPQAGVLIQTRYAFVGLFYDQQEKTTELGLRFTPHNNIFIKYKNTQSQWRNDFELNPDTPAESYDIKFPLHTDIKLYGGGWNLARHSLSLSSEVLLSDNKTNNSQSHKLRWKASIKQSLELEFEQHQHAPGNQAIVINQKIQGRWKTRNQYRANTLTWTINKHASQHQFYLRHNQWQLDLEGNYNARALINHWASILVGGGRFKFNQNTQFSAVGINSNNPTKQLKGRLWSYGIALGQLKLTSDGGHIVYQYPIGTLLNNPLTLADQKTDIALLSIATGYRWPQFEWRYRYAQVVPLREHNSDSPQADTSPNQAPQTSAQTPPTDWTRHLKRLPDGSRHTLEIRYLF